MNYEQFKAEMESYRHDADIEANAHKDPQLALDRLHSLYRKFDASEQAMADRVLGEWTLSPDEGMRFDALALIDEFEVRLVVPALRELVIRLQVSDAPGAPYELEKVKRIIGKLT